MPENIKCLRIPKRQMQFIFRVSLLDWDAIDHCKTFFCSFPSSQTFEKFIGTNEVLIPLFGVAWCKLNSRIMACAINRSMQQKDIACKNGESYFWNQGNAFFPFRTHSCYVCTKWTKIWSTKPTETEMPSLKIFSFFWCWSIFMNYKIEFIFVVPLIYCCLFCSSTQYYYQACQCASVHTFFKQTI